VTSLRLQGQPSDDEERFDGAQRQPLRQCLTALANCTTRAEPVGYVLISHNAVVANAMLAGLAAKDTRTLIWKS
jgi:hypothetical protein